MTEARIERQHRHQRERRARRQSDRLLRAAVSAMGGDPDDFTTEDSPERRKGIRRAQREGYGDE